MRVCHNVMWNKRILLLLLFQNSYRSTGQQKGSGNSLQNETPFRAIRNSRSSRIGQWTTIQFNRIQNVCRKIWIPISNISPRYPQSNGKIENSVKTVKKTSNELIRSEVRSLPRTAGLEEHTIGVFERVSSTDSTRSAWTNTVPNQW